MEVARDGEEFPVAALIGSHVPFPQAVVDHAERRVFLEGLYDACELAGQKEVVGVEQGDDLAAGLGDSKVKRRGLATVWFGNIPNARTIFLDALGSVVGGTVVDDQNFDLIEREILRENAIDSLLDELAVVMRRDQDGD